MAARASTAGPLSACMFTTDPSRPTTMSNAIIPCRFPLRASAGYVGWTRWTSNFSITSAGTRACGFSADAISGLFNPDSNSSQPRFQRHQKTATPNTTKTRKMVHPDRKSTRLNSSHLVISYAVFCLKKKKNHNADRRGECQRPHQHEAREADQQITPRQDLVDRSRDAERAVEDEEVCYLNGRGEERVDPFPSPHRFEG